MSVSSPAPQRATTTSIRQAIRSRLRALVALAFAPLLALMLSSSSTKAQPAILDCSCLATQSVLFTTNCSGIVPDLCLVVSNCYTPSMIPPPGYVCFQTPVPGTAVTGTTPITFTIVEAATGITNTCIVNYNLGFSTNRFTLLCPTNQFLACNATNFTFYGPQGWTNVPLCCTNPVQIFGPFITTNWPTITAQWIGQVCGVVDFCTETITFGNSFGTNCPCLDIICPSNIVVQTCFNTAAGTALTNVIYPPVVVSNSCIGVVTNITYTPPSGSPFPVGTNTVSVTVQDNLGNVAVCSFDVIVLGDIDPPIINCPPVQTVQCGGWTPTPPPAFDVCCTNNVTVMIQSIFTNVISPCLTTVFIDWHFTDCNGNSTNCTEVVNIVDTTPPVIVCNSNQTVQCGFVTPLGTPWAPIPPTATDACCPNPPVVSLVSIITNSSSACNETLTLTWMAEDCCTNIAYCTETITITDTNPPVINCQPFKQIDCGTGPYWFGDYPTAFDACCGTNVTLNLIGVITNIQTTCFSDYNLAWTATDCCTNTSLVCTQRLQIVDFTPPNVICGTNKTELCGTPWTFDPPIAIDDCCTNPPTIIVTSTVTNGFCPKDIIRTWQITDCCGNTTNCTQVVIEIDNVPPVLTCNSNQTVQCGSTWTFTPPTAVDNCCTNTAGGPGVTITLFNVTTNSSGPCSEIITALWQAQDCCGNKSFCTETVTVIDTVPPVLSCTNQTISCGFVTPNGTPWTPTPPPALDACCGTNVTVSLLSSITNGSIPCNEIITLTWQATDCCTNTAFCTEIVTITDTNPPVITCASNKFVECGTAWTFDPPTAFDACCGTNVTITVLSNITWTSTTCVSIYEQFWMATDCCTNNSAVCSQRVIVQDTTPPVVNCPTNFTINCNTPWSFGTPTATDVCCGASVTINLIGTVTNGVCPMVVTRAWNITDCCGNSTTCAQSVTIVDNVPPVITCGPNQTVQCGTPWTFNTPTATDNCCTNSSGGAGGVSIVIQNLITNNIGPCQDFITVWWKATDCCGNASFCTNTVTVIDSLPPVLNCTNYTLQCGSPLIVPTATDLCCPNPTVSLLSATTNIINSCTSILTLTWQAIDCCTNTTTCVETVTVTDTTPPVVTCPPNITVQCGTTWSFGTPTAFDACCGSNVTITVQFTTPPFGTPCVQTTTRQWLITDCCSNSITCSQTVTIVDTVPPVLTCPPSFSVAPGSPWSFGTPTAVDACYGTNNTIVVMATVTNVTGPCQITYTRLWTAVDPCGNMSAPCSQSIYTSSTPPPNDPCPSPFPIIVNAPYICGSNICATPSAPGTLTPVPCGASANAPDVWYTVTAVCTGPLTVDTCGSCAPYPTFDTVLSAYTGNCGSLVQVPATAPQTSCNDDWCGLQSRIVFNAVAGQTYRIRVSGFAGATGWFRIRATQSTTAPPNDLCANAIVIASNSLPATICGTTLCSATPTPPGNLFPTPCGASANTPDVWYRFTPQCSGLIQINTCGTCAPAGTFDTVVSVYTGICPGPLNQVAGACNDDCGPSGPCPWTLQSFVQFNATAGVTYYIRVSGWAGSTGDFRLNINQITTPPPNNMCAAATNVTAGTHAWNNCGATTDGPAGHCGIQNDVWFNYTPACSGQVMLNTCGSSINTGLAVYSGNCGSLGLIGCNDNAGAGSCSGSQQSYLTFNAIAGTTYRIRVGGVGGAQGGGVLNIVGPNPAATTCGTGPVSNWRLFIVTGPGNGTPWAWQVSSPCCANLYQPNTAGVVSGGPGPVAAAFAASINAQCPGTALSGTFWGFTYLAIGTRCGPTAPVILGVGPAFTAPNNLCIVGGLGLSTFGACSFNPDIFSVELTGRDDNHNDRDDMIDIVTGDSADVNGNLIPDEVETCVAPEVTAKPDSQLVEVGQNATLAVAVSGTPPFSYQWLRNGFPIPGATSSTLTINPVTTNDLGAYSVTVSNECGTLEGTAADVYVQPTYLPVLTDASLADGWFRFMVETKIGYDYVIEYKNNLNEATWTTLTNTPGIGAPQLIYDAAPPSDQRFYRVIQIPSGP